jgi:hypothetical protein
MTGDNNVATSAERQQRFKANRLRDGEKELRGLYVPEHLHAQIKKEIKEMVRRMEYETHS